MHLSPAHRSVLAARPQAARFGNQPSAKAPGFTRNDALQLLMRGDIDTFNEQLTTWRQQHPGQYFDLSGVNFTTLLQNLPAMQSLHPHLNTEAVIDFRSVDLRKADFRGLKVIRALLTEGEADPQYGETPSGRMDALTDGILFSPSTIKILT
jgi:hypothetical protein